jgi:hypothetical protein
MRILKSEAKAMKSEGSAGAGGTAATEQAPAAAATPEAITPSEVRTAQESATTTAK